MNYEKIKSGALALLVLTSLGLTWGIWNYQPSYETIKEGAADIVTEVEIGQQRKISELLKPAKIVSHLGTSHSGTVSSEELTWIMKEMGEWTFNEPENISSSLNEYEFSRLLRGESHIELFFSSFVPFSTIKNIFSFNDTDVPNAVFDRMVITQAEKDKDKAFVYFISVQERLVFKSQVESISLTNFKNRYLKKPTRLEPYISYQIPNGSLLYIREEPPVLAVLNYLPEQIDAETFQRALFNDPSYVRRGSRSGSEEYTDGSSFMRINSNTGMIRYVNSAEATQSMALDQLIEKSISFVNDHNGWVDHYRLFRAKPGSSNISYRLFLGDFPVFNSQGMAEISQIWGRNRIYQYDRSSFFIQLDNPLPESGKTVKLMSGEEAINQVLKQENVDPSYITDMRIGYEMTLERESPKILAFKPHWYYKYNENWRKVITEEGEQADGLE